MQTIQRAVTHFQSHRVLSFFCFCLCRPLKRPPSFFSAFPSLVRTFLPSALSFRFLLYLTEMLLREILVELSDLNKCLRLERRLSWGLGFLCGSWCSSRSAVPLCLDESLSQPPSLLRLSLSILWHLFLMARETCGKPAPRSLAR